MEQLESDVPAVVQPPADSGRSRRLLWWGMLGGAGLLLCGLAVIIGMTWYRGQLQQKRVEALLEFENVRIFARFSDYAYTPRGIDAKSGWGAPRFFGTEDSPPIHLRVLERIFDRQCFVRVTKIEVSNPSFSDADVPLLLAFHELRHVDLWECKLTDQGVRQFAAVKRLVVLNVRVPLSSETIRHFAACRELRELRIDTSQADPETVAELQRKLPECRIYESPPR